MSPPPFTTSGEVRDTIDSLWSSSYALTKCLWPIPTAALERSFKPDLSVDWTPSSFLSTQPHPLNTSTVLLNQVRHEKLVLLLIFPHLQVWPLTPTNTEKVRRKRDLNLSLITCGTSFRDLNRKKWFCYSNKIRDNKWFLLLLQPKIAATKRIVDRTKYFVVVTKYFCYPYFNKWLCWYNKTFFFV